jgi:hypothetical protein
MTDRAFLRPGSPASSLVAKQKPVALGSALRPNTRCQDYAGLIMPNLIAKVTSQVGQNGVGSCRSICRGTPKFRAMVLSATSDFFAFHSGEITSRPRATRNLMRHRPGREVRGPTVERLKFSARVAGHRCPDRAAPDWRKAISKPIIAACRIRTLIARFRHDVARTIT